jgi:hypothetical protein
MGIVITPVIGLWSKPIDQPDAGGIMRNAISQSIATNWQGARLKNIHGRDAWRSVLAGGCILIESPAASDARKRGIATSQQTEVYPRQKNRGNR